MSRRGFLALPSIHIRKFPSVQVISNDRLVRMVGSYCNRTNVSRAVIIYHSGGQTGVCGGKVEGAVLFQRSRLGDNSLLVITGGGCF